MPADADIGNPRWADWRRPMDHRQIIRMALEEYYEELTKALDGLTPEERRFQPGPDSHHIDFVVWHMARVEDVWVQGFARDVEPVWTRDGWSDKLGIPPNHGGYGYTAEQVRDLPRFDFSDVIEYYESVRKETFAYLDTVEKMTWTMFRAAATTLK